MAAGIEPNPHSTHCRNSESSDIARRPGKRRRRCPATIGERFASSPREWQARPVRGNRTAQECPQLISSLSLQLWHYHLCYRRHRCRGVGPLRMSCFSSQTVMRATTMPFRRSTIRRCAISTVATLSPKDGRNRPIVSRRPRQAGGRDIGPRRPKSGCHQSGT